MHVSRAIAKRSVVDGWSVAPGRERNGNVLTFIISYFPCLFSRADIEHHGVQPESLSYHAKLLKWLLFQK